MSPKANLVYVDIYDPPLFFFFILDQISNEHYTYKVLVFSKRQELRTISGNFFEKKLDNLGLGRL